METAISIWKQAFAYGNDHFHIETGHLHLETAIWKLKQAFAYGNDHFDMETG
jgi:hypothetical protein